jgi:predicted adenine nucleotide alpha hydrolase (AANH) superfamily ATPase
MNLECKTDDEYGLIPFIRKVLPVFEREEEADRRSARPPSARCAVCYRMRLEKTAARAAEWGFEFFSTTLLVSPYQNHELVRETAEECGEKYAVRFLYRDFRPLFREGKARARDMELYMQKYCGCIFSEEERYLRRRIPAAGIARA